LKPYYQDEAVTIYHGDCREIAPTIEKPAVIVSDPPYGIGWSRGVNNARASKQHSGILNDQDTSCRDEMLAIFPDIPAVLFGSFYAPFPQNLKQVLVWKKPADSGLVGSVTGFRRDAEPIFLVGPWPVKTCQWSSVLSDSKGMSAVTSETGHPHTKPIGLLIQIIERVQGGVILDPFMGSGSTLRAAKDLGRRAVGIELDECYCETAARRMGQEVLNFA